jgi:hypothetical protein
MRTNLERFGDAAEQYGSSIAETMLNSVLSADDQAEACRVVVAALTNAFHCDDPVKYRIAAGFGVRIVNVIERGLDSIRADGVQS